MSGIGEFLGGLGYLFKKIPLQSRVERWKNEIDKLEREKAELLITKADVKKAKRMSVIERRLVELHKLCKNKASDD